MSELTQKSDEWYAARLGKLTASKIADATAKIKSGEAASRRTYRAQLVAERLTGIPQGVDLSNNKAVQWGNEYEPLARAAYEAETGTLVDEVGFMLHTRLPMTGASPDGLIGKHSTLEIKCPNTPTHIEYLKANVVPPEYRKQVLWQLACAERTTGIFVSFDPRMDPGNQLLIVEWVPSWDEIEALEMEALQFLNEVAADTAWLKERPAIHAAVQYGKAA
jgi:putative phage-type endonuclease